MTTPGELEALREALAFSEHARRSWEAEANGFEAELLELRRQVAAFLEALEAQATTLEARAEMLRLLEVWRQAPFAPAKP
jgi:hypothetical protein